MITRYPGCAALETEHRACVRSRRGGIRPAWVRSRRDSSSRLIPATTLFQSIAWRRRPLKLVVSTATATPASWRSLLTKLDHIRKLRSAVCGLSLEVLPFYYRCSSWWSHRDTQREHRTPHGTSARRAHSHRRRSARTSPDGSSVRAEIAIAIKLTSRSGVLQATRIGLDRRWNRAPTHEDSRIRDLVRQSIPVQVPHNDRRRGKR